MAELGSLTAAFCGLGEKTGGLCFQQSSRSPEAAREIVTKVLEHVDAAYVAGYYAQPVAGEAKSRRVEVRLRSKNLGRLEGGTRLLVR